MAGDTKPSANRLDDSGKSAGLQHAGRAVRQGQDCHFSERIPDRGNGGDLTLAPNAGEKRETCHNAGDRVAAVEKPLGALASSVTRRLQVPASHQELLVCGKAHPDRGRGALSERDRGIGVACRWDAHSGTPHGQWGEHEETKQTDEIGR